MAKTSHYEVREHPSLGNGFVQVFWCPASGTEKLLYGFGPGRLEALRLALNEYHEKIVAAQSQPARSFITDAGMRDADGIRRAWCMGTSPHAEHQFNGGDWCPGLNELARCKFCGNQIRQETSGVAWGVADDTGYPYPVLYCPENYGHWPEHEPHMPDGGAR